MATSKKTKDKESYKKIQKDLEIKKEIKKINVLFKDLDKNIKKAVESMIQNAAFMSVTLRELQDTMIEEGLKVEYQNGENQFGIKKSPDVEIYNTMIKNFVSTMNAIAGFLPKDVGKKLQDDGFEDFVHNR